MKRPIVCCPGSINPDLKLKTEVNKGIKTFSGRYLEDLGGKGCDTCCAIKNVAGDERKVYLVGCVGKDRWAGYVMRKLKKKKIETDFVFRKNGMTGLVLEYIFGNGEVDVGFAPGVNQLLDAKDIAQAEGVIRSAALVIGEIENTIDATATSFQIAKRHRVPTLLDPSIVPRDPAERKILFEEVLPLTDILMPDRYELAELTGIHPTNRENLVRAAKKLLKYSKILCITLGSKGVYVSDKRQYAILPTFKVDAVDAGGVGDTFRGLFGYRLVKYCEQSNIHIEELPFDALMQAAQYASAGAAIAISRYGTLEAIPTKAEIEGFLKKHGLTTIL